jgi:anti-sigma B factor antagonist
MSSFARVDVEWHDDVPVARIAGEVDGANVDQSDGQLGGLVTNHMHEIVVDLTPTTYLDSAGLNVLFALGSELARHQQRLRLVLDAGTPIARVVRIVGLDTTHPTYPTVEEALAARDG